MRVLFLTNFYPPHAIGGYEQWCEEVAVRLKDRGHVLTVLTSRFDVRPDAPEVEDVTRTLFLQTDNNYYRPFDFFLQRSSQEQFNIQELRNKIDAFRPDVLLVWGMWNLSHYLPYMAEKWLPGRVAYYISSYWPIDVDLHTSYWRTRATGVIGEIAKKPVRALALAKLRRESYPPRLQFEHAVCCSEYVRRKLVDAGKLPRTAGVMLGGTDPEPFMASSARCQFAYDEESRPLRLLYFGRLIYDKGVHTAIDALGMLRQQGLAESVELTILGRGHPDYEASLKALVDELGVHEQVRFAGQVPRSEVPRWLADNDVFLFTSIWPEPMARSVMEAMAAGLLVIGTEVGGQVEMLVHGRNALTYLPEHADQLAAHIVQVLDKPALRTRLAQAGQQMVLKRFTLDRMVSEIEQYLLEVIASSPSVLG